MEAVHWRTAQLMCAEIQRGSLHWTQLCLLVVVSRRQRQRIAVGRCQRSTRCRRWRNAESVEGSGKLLPSLTPILSGDSLMLVTSARPFDLLTIDYSPTTRTHHSIDRISLHSAHHRTPDDPRRGRVKRSHYMLVLCRSTSSPSTKRTVSAHCTLA